jgi:hypothetical protein
MRKSLWIIALVFTAIVAPTQLRADDIQYTVSQSLPAGGITGTITTDGTLGSLALADIVGWNLTITSYSSSETLTQSNSTVVSGPVDGLSATSTALTSDFPDATFGYLKFAATSPTEGFVVWVVGNAPGSDGYIAANATTNDTGAETYEYVYSSQVIADNGVPVPTPEPGTSSLMMIGLGLLGLMVLIQRRKALALPQAS